MPDYAAIALDIREVAAGRGMKLTEKEVDAAVRLHLRGKGYLDSIKQASGALSHAEEMKSVSRKESQIRSAGRGGLASRKERAA